MNQDPTTSPSPDTENPAPATAAPSQAPLQPGLTPNPGKTLGIIGFILSFIAFLNVAGLILSIIGYVKSKKVGITNGLAIAGIAISIVTILMTASVVSYVAPRVTQILEKCSTAQNATVLVEGVRYDCPEGTYGAMGQDSSLNDALFPVEGDNTASDPTDVANSPVTLDGSTVSATCFSFTVPTGFILSPNARTCQAELRLENGTATGAAATSIKVVAQRGAQISLDEFADRIRATGAEVAEENTVTINGIKSAHVVAEDSLGIPQAMYYIPDTSGKFAASNGVITSYMISGPSTLKSELDTILSSFKIK